MKIKQKNGSINIFNNWKKTEVLWLLSATAIITALSIYWGDSLVGILSALTGIVCVILTAKGKISCFGWGLINCALYAYIGFQNKYYGEFLLNAFYYIPMQFVGFYTWKKHMKDTGEVKSRVMTLKSKLVLLLVSLISISCFGTILTILGGRLPYIDAVTNVLSIAAMILSIKRYAEQWILWIVIDVVSVGMWVYAMTQGSDNIATLLMWTVYLGNAIWGYIKWKREASR